MMVAILKLFRFPLVFTAVADSAGGYLIALGGGRPDPLTILLLAVASGGLYCFGMAMNDIADLERDRTLHPSRVLPSGRISRRGAVAAAFGVLVISFAALLAGRGIFAIPWLLVWGMIVALIALYDFVLKAPPLMGAVRMANFVLGVVVALSDRSLVDIAGSTVLIFSVVSFIYVSALTFISTLEDRQARKGVVRALALVMCASVVVAFLTGKAVSPPGSPACWIAGGPLIVWILARAWRATRRERIMLLVRDGVAGIILLDASMVLSCGLLVPGLAVAALILPAALGVWGFKRLA